MANETQPQSNPMQPPPANIPVDPEVVFYQGSPRLKGEFFLLFQSLGAAAVLAGLGFAVMRYAPTSMGNIPMFVGIALWVLALIALLLPSLLVRRQRYRITNYRIDLETGIIGKRIESTEINRVHDVGFKQGILDRIVGVGTITLHSSDATNPVLQLRSLPEPRKLYDMLKRRVDEVKVKQRVLRVDNV
jgi:uncharacterized membrane protein YdbT with pleckstrin-like domain